MARGSVPHVKSMISVSLGPTSATFTQVSKSRLPIAPLWLPHWLSSGGLFAIQEIKIHKKISICWWTYRYEEDFLLLTFLCLKVKGKENGNIYIYKHIILIVINIKYFSVGNRFLCRHNYLFNLHYITSVFID